MADSVPFFIRAAATGLPNATATPAFADAGSGPEFRNVVTHALRTPCAFFNLGNGQYSVTPTDADETAGVAAIIDCGAGNEPRYIGLSIHKGDNSNQRWVLLLTDESGALWTGGAPTVGGYADRTGVARAAPTPDAVAGAYLWAFTPTADDVTAEVSISINAPAGALPEEVQGHSSPVIASPWPAPSPGPVNNPAADLVSFLDTKVAGGLTLAAGVNLFAGPRRRADKTGAPAIFAMNTGGPAPTPYLGGHRQSEMRALVQVLCRWSANDLEAGEQFARDIFAWLHLQAIPGYRACFGRDSQPAFLGEDSLGHHQWTLNFELQYTSTLQ